MERKTIIYIIIAVLAVVIVYVAIFKSTSSKSSWICVNNQWVKFGNPSTPIPQTPCSAAASQAKPIVNFQAVGTIASEDDPPQGWKFVYGGSGSVAYLLFVNASVCDFGKGGESCPLSKSVVNIIGSKVSIAGERNGDKVVVAKLTLTK